MPVGIDTSRANNDAAALLGEAPGETFLAVDTLIRSITVWRVAVEAHDGTPMKLWITEVDAAGRPLIDQVVFSGPTITVTNGDGIHPTAIQFAFDPPFALGRRGKYFFAVQERCGTYFDLLTVWDVDRGCAPFFGQR